MLTFPDLDVHCFFQIATVDVICMLSWKYVNIDNYVKFLSMYTNSNY